MRRSATAARRLLCTARPSEPLLPKWGSFGKTLDDVDKLVDNVKEDGDRQAAVTRQLAEMALKIQAMVTRPVQWFKYAHATPFKHMSPAKDACAASTDLPFLDATVVSCAWRQ